MELARRSRLLLTYDNVDISADLAPYLLGFSYTDHASGKADDIQITLEDRAGLWKAEWLPEKGASLRGGILVSNWDKVVVDEGLLGSDQELPLGTFEIDEIETSGPPEVVKIKGLSIPESTSLREEKTRAWEQARLSVIARDIAAGAGMVLVYEADDDPTIDRIEQTEQTDLAFLLKPCEDNGLSLKVTGGQIVIFDDSKYEQMDPVMTITRGVTPVISYSAVSSTREIYSAATVAYQGGKYFDPVVYTYRPPNAPATGKTLKINERVGSLAEAERLARKRLRQKNKDENRFTLTMQGNINLVAGVTVMIEGWGAFDGKYFIEEATHKGPGYTTSLDLRRVLEGY
jgi:hypothetical protein